MVRRLYVQQGDKILNGFVIVSDLGGSGEAVLTIAAPSSQFELSYAQVEKMMDVFSEYLDGFQRPTVETKEAARARVNAERAKKLEE